jgi:DNA polymerase-3 subunit epsilon
MIDLSQPWTTARWVAFDVESTGRDRFEDRIVELGLVTFEGGEVVDRWQSMVNPGRPIDPEASKVSGITDDDVKDAPPLETVLPTLLEKIAGAPMLAYNHDFDLGMLAAEMARLGQPWSPPPCLDPLPFVWEHLRDRRLVPNAKLGTAAAYLQVSLDQAHRADHDAEAAGRVMLALRDVADLPESLDDLLKVQAVLHAKVEERFARMRGARTGERGPVLGAATAIELGPAWLYGDEPDPIRALFLRVPDVRHAR